MREGLTPPVEALLERFQEGKRIALARAISLVENERPGFQAFLHEVVSRGPEAAIGCLPGCFGNALSHGWPMDRAAPE